MIIKFEQMALMRAENDLRNEYGRKNSEKFNASKEELGLFREDGQNALTGELFKLQEECDELEKEIIENYTEKLTKNASKIFEDMVYIFEKITRKDFSMWVKEIKTIVKRFQFDENYETAKLFLNYITLKYEDVIKQLGIESALKRYSEEVEKKALQWYPDKMGDAAITKTQNFASLVPTNKAFDFALTSRVNDVAYIMYSDQMSLQVDEEGNWHYEFAPIDLSSKQLLEAGYNEGLLGILVRVGYQCCEENTDSITISINEFAKSINADTRKTDYSSDNETKHHGVDIIGMINKVERFKGYYRGNVYNVITVSYGLRDETITIGSPYFKKVVEEIRNNKKQIKNTKGNATEIEEFADTVKPSIAMAKNKKTASVVRYLAGRIEKKGTTHANTEKEENGEPGRKNAISITVSYEEIINNVPIIKKSLEETYPKKSKDLGEVQDLKKDLRGGKDPKRRTEALKRIFIGNRESGKDPILVEYMKKYTVLYDKLKDLKIEVPSPAWSDLKSEIKISYGIGTNSEFSNPYSITKKVGEV